MNKLKSIILSILIAITLFSFVLYLTQTVKPAPQWEDYCEDRIRPLPFEESKIQNQTLCIQNNGTWVNGYCDYYKECQKEYDGARQDYNYIVFIISIIVGLLAVIAGIILKLPSVSFGLMLGGVFLFIYGPARYWDQFANPTKAIIMAIVLVILIWIGYKKLKT